jgi:hypothetical protein
MYHNQQILQRESEKKNSDGKVQDGKRILTLTVMGPVV